MRQRILLLLLKSTAPRHCKFWQHHPFHGCMKFHIVIHIQAVRTYNQEIHMKQLLDELDFYVLPVVNIDGYVYTWTKVCELRGTCDIHTVTSCRFWSNCLIYFQDRMWRKTRSTMAGSSCLGVDPNRNFNAGWCGEYMSS